MRCFNCGNEYIEGSNFCGFCGKNLLEQTSDTNITGVVSQNSIKDNAQIPVIENHTNSDYHQQDFQTTDNSLNKPDKELEVLKLLSVFSVLIFLLPVGKDWNWFFYNFTCNELAAITVPFFVSALILLLILLFNLTSKKVASKLALGLGFLNLLFSLCLVLPLPFKTQTLCLGSFALLLVSATVFIYGFVILIKLARIKNTEHLREEFFKNTAPYRMILKVIALIGMIAFFFPVLLSSCTLGGSTTVQKETGISIIKNSYGYGNAYVIVILSLFLLILTSLFIKKRALIIAPFVLGLSNLILLIMSKIVFADYIVEYYVGGYIVFFVALAITIGGHIYYKVSRRYIINSRHEVIKKLSRKEKAINLIVYILVIITSSVCFLSPTLYKHPGIGSQAKQKPILEEESLTNAPPVNELSSVYTFEQICAVQPQYFNDGGDVFSVTSKKENYYGEIKVGSKSYIDGMSDELIGTYAVFIDEGYSTFLEITFKADGYYNNNVRFGTAIDNSVMYPWLNDDFFGSLQKCTDGSSKSLLLNNLSYIFVDWRRSESVFNERSFNMLAVVFSKDEAIRYVQEGTLPYCLQGLTVTGLDEIFKKPNTAMVTPTESTPSDEIVDAPASDFSYVYDASKTCTIMGYTGKDEYIRIPDTIEGMEVAAIWQFAFLGREELKGVVIPDTVTRIGKSAFAGCYGLTSVTIPNSVVSIEKAAFAECSNLDEATRNRIIEINPEALSGY
jgi:hypothetical protein